MSQQFDSELLNLVKQKGFYPFKHLCDIEKFNEILTSKKEFYSSLRGEEISGKEYQHVFKVWNKFEMKTMKDYHNLCLTYEICA